KIRLRFIGDALVKKSVSCSFGENMKKRLLRFPSITSEASPKIITNSVPLGTQNRCLRELATLA
ncbi:hypothetical protein PIB30_105596, partial [Stylosanthes scabra]|nr:hypothetical protein [Stylosanthes scabra]